jgi:hypothetical protein
MAGNVAQAASKLVLRTRRPAAPGKKHDDAVGSMQLWQQQPLQQQGNSQVRATAVAGRAASSTGGVASSAPRGSMASSAAAAAAAAPGDSGTGDASAAAASAGKPPPASLRSRRGWGAWGSSLVGRGWVSAPGDGSSGMTQRTPSGGSRMVAYLGQTAGQVAGATGQLLRSSNVLLNGCAAPLSHQHAAVAAAAAAAAAAGEQSPLNGGSSSSTAAGAAWQQASPHEHGVALAPPFTSSGMERGHASCSSPLAAVAAAAAAAAAQLVAADDQGSEDSEDDPDLQDQCLDAGKDSAADADAGAAAAAAFDIIHQPALRANISALIAAVSTGADQPTARAHAHEAQAAELLLQDVRGGGSNPNLQQLQAQQRQQWAASSTPVEPGPSHLRPAQQQQQQQQQHADASPAAAGAAAAAGGGYSRAPQEAGSKHGSRSEQDEPVGVTATVGGGGAGGSTPDRDRAAERLARRRMYPAGRVLHLMPRCACPPWPRGGREGDAAAAAAASDGGCSEQDSQRARQLPPLTAALGSVGLGDSYVLLEVPNVEVYGRMKLNPAMVRDHFIPSYVRALDSVLRQLDGIIAAGVGARAGAGAGAGGDTH